MADAGRAQPSGVPARRVSDVPRGATILGTVGSPVHAFVDGRGSLSTAGWSLDWWVGAEDRWHYPALDAAVRQSLVGLAPVVQTAMRVPGGDVVARAYGLPGHDRTAGLLMVEVENSSAAPIELALVLLAPDPEVGGTPFERVELTDDRVVTVDGRATLVLPRRPAALISARPGEHLARLVAAHVAGASSVDGAGVGLAGAAVVYPVAHRAVLRVAVLLDAPGAAVRRPERRRSARDLDVTAVPSPGAVARGWAAQAQRGVRLALPAGRLADAVAANRAYLLAFQARHAGSQASLASDRSLGQAASLAGALDRFGFPRESREVLRGLAAGQSWTGWFSSADDGGDAVEANSAVLDVVAEHWSLGRDREALDELLGSVWRAAKAIKRRGRGDRSSAIGMHAAATLLAAGGERRRAAWCEGHVGLALADLAGVEQSAPSGGEPFVRSPVNGAVSAARTFRVASAELARGERVALSRLRWAVGASSETFTWPAAEVAEVGEPPAAAWHDVDATASFLSLVRDLLVREVRLDGGSEPTTLAICSLLPDDWFGQEVEVGDAPTAAGRLSFALRWHGRRPAVLWELDRHDAVGPVRLIAPGLDRTWSSDAPEGDALLAAWDPLDAVGSGGREGGVRE